MKFQYLLPLLAGIAFMACEKEVEAPQGGGTDQNQNYVEHSLTFNIGASFSSESGAAKTLSWTAGDVVELYSESGTYEYVYDGEGNSFTSASTPEGKVLYAAYPGANCAYTTAGFTLTLPATTQWNENGTFTCPLVATVDAQASGLSSVDMKIPVGLLNVNYSGVPDGYSALEVSSVGTRLAGAFKVESDVIKTIATSTVNVARVTFPTLTAPKDMSFWIPVPTGTYSSLTFRLTGENVDDLMVADMADQIVEAGKMYSLTTDKNMILKWGDIPEEDLVFPFEGGSKDYSVVSNATWTVSSDNPEITAVKKDENTVTVTVPAGEALGGLSAEIKLASADPATVIAPAVMTVTQSPNPKYNIGSGSVVSYNPDGSTILSISPAADGMDAVGRSYLKFAESTKYGTHTFIFGDMNISSGLMDVQWWFSGKNIQIQMGYFNRVYHNTSLYFTTAPTYEVINRTKKMVIKLFPATNEGVADAKAQVYFDDVLMADVWLGSDIWADETVNGSGIEFGLNSRTDCPPDPMSSITILSHSFTEEY